MFSGCTCRTAAGSVWYTASLHFGKLCEEDCTPCSSSLPSSSVASMCLIGKQKKPILFKVTEPSSVPVTFKVDLNPESENLESLRTKTISVIPTGDMFNLCYSVCAIQGCL